MHPMKTLLLVIVLCTLSLAQSKPNPPLEPPSLSPEKKAELFKLQRDYSLAVNAAQPYNAAVDNVRNELNKRWEEANKGIAQDKWKLNAQTLEYEAVPPKDKPKSDPAKQETK